MVLLTRTNRIALLLCLILSGGNRTRTEELFTTGTKIVNPTLVNFINVAWAKFVDPTHTTKTVCLWLLYLVI